MQNTIHIYARFSSERQRNGTSEDRQQQNALEAGKQFINQSQEFKDYTLNEYIFFDRAVSSFKGKNLLDPDSEWNKLVKIVQPNDLVLLEANDRFSRLPAHRAMTILEDFLIKKACKVIFLDNPHLVLTAENFTDGFNDLGTFVKQKSSNDYVKKLSDNVSKSYKVRKRNFLETGRPYRQKAPGWLTWNDDTKCYELNEKAKAIKYIFELAINGHGIRSIVRKLNEEKISHLGTYKTSRHWANVVIRRILTEKTVLGYNLNVEPTLKMYPAAIDEDTWYRANAKIDERRTKKFYGPIGGVRNLFQGVVKCAKCGNSMVIHSCKGKDKTQTFHYLQCSGAIHGTCSSRQLSYKQAEQSFLNFVELPTSASAALFRNCFVEQQNEDNSQPTYEILEGKLAEVKKNIVEASKDYKEKPSKVLAGLMHDLEIEESDLVAKIEQQKLQEAGKVERNAMGCELRGKFLSEWSLRNHDEAFRMQVRELIRQLIDKITVDVQAKTYFIHFKNEAKPIRVDCFRNGCSIDGSEVIPYKNAKTDLRVITA